VQREFLPLDGFRAITLAVNVPGPAAACRLRKLGAEITKVEPPDGDPLEAFCPAWYTALHEGIETIRLNLKDPEERSGLEGLLAESDLLLTSSRPAALERLGLGWPQLQQRHPHLSQVSIVGYPPPDENVPGHDLTYQADLGLIRPPQMPRTLLADLAGAERAVSAALGLLLARERGGEAGYAQVSLAEAASSFADPLRHGLTAPGGPLGGGLPGYALYETKRGWIAIAALEPHFLKRLERGLGLKAATRGELEEAFRTRDAQSWESWGAERDLPIAALPES
jgi:alpha-methylacyl-CoA racemase